MTIYYQVGAVSSLSDFNNANNWSLTNDVSGSGAGIPGAEDEIIRGSAAPEWVLWQYMNITCKSLVNRDDATTPFRSPTTSAAQYTFNVGYNGTGVLYLSKNQTTAADNAATFNITCGDVYINTVASYTVFKFLGDSTLCLGNLTSFNGGGDTIDNIAVGAKVKFVKTPQNIDSSDYVANPANLPSIPLFATNGGMFISRGEFDLTEADEFRIHYTTGIPGLKNYGTLRNDDPSKAVFINASSSGVVHCLLGTVNGRFTASIPIRYNSTVSINQFQCSSPMESLQISQFASAPATTIQILSGTRFGNTTIAINVADCLIIYTDIELYGDFSLGGSNTITTGSGVFQASVVGTADQVLENQTDMTFLVNVWKPAGVVTLAGRKFKFVDEVLVGGFVLGGINLEVDTSGYTVTTGEYGWHQQGANFEELNISNSTLVNYGDLQFSVTLQHFVYNTNTKYYQYGGTSEHPNKMFLYFVSFSGGGLATQGIAELVFTEGSFTQITSGFGYGVAKTVRFLGWTDMRVISELRMNNQQSLVEFGEHSHVLASEFYLAGQIQGFPENVEATRFTLVGGVNADGMTFNIHVDISNAFPGTIDLQNTTIRGNLRYMSQTEHVEVDVLLSGATFCGNVDFSRASYQTAPVTVSGSITLAGSGDQKVDFSSVILIDSPTHVGFDKTVAGKTDTIVSNSAICMSGNQWGTIKLLGTGSFTTCGELTVERIDTSELAGSFVPGDFVINYRPQYVDMGYTGFRFVAFETVGHHTLSSKEFVQNVANI